MNWYVIVAGVPFLFLTAAVTALVLRLAWTRRNDPADVDLRERVAPYVDRNVPAGGYTPASSSNVRVIRGEES